MGSLTRIKEVRLGDLDSPEAWKATVDEEHLHGDVRLNVRLGQERDDVSTGEVLDRLLIAFLHDHLEGLAHGHDSVRVTAVHDRLLERRKPLPRITTMMMSSRT
jgi:hypothetical protein